MQVSSEGRSAADESNIDHQHCQRTIRQLKEQNRQVYNMWVMCMSVLTCMLNTFKKYFLGYCSSI